jgi:hypothetical protein
MKARGMKPIFRSSTALVLLMLIGLAAGPLRAAGAAKEDCRLDGEAHAFQCLWDQENFQGNLKAVTPPDLAGQCMSYSIKSAANNGKSGMYTLYLYEQGNCAGDSISKLNAGESVGSVTAQSARFAPKDSYR